MTATLTESAEPGTDAWRRRITASKIPGIFGASKYSSPTKEFHLLRGEVAPDGSNDAIERGNDFEPVILARFFRRHPELERIDAGSFTRPGLEEWASATPDAMARHRATGEVFVVEAKTDGRGDYQWGPTGSASIPLGYYLQVQWQLHMTRCRRAYVVCLGPFFDETEHPIDYDGQMAFRIEMEAHDFWVNAFSDNPVLPPVDGHPETYNAIRRAHPEITRGDGEDWPISIDLARQFVDAVDALEAAEDQMNLMRSTMLRVMGRARRAVIGHGKSTQVVATRQPTKTGAALYKFRKPVDFEKAALPPEEPRPSKSA